MQQTAPQSVGQMLSWDKFDIYPLNWSYQKCIQRCPRRTGIPQSVCPLETKMGDKRAKTSTFKYYSFTKEGIKFMEPIVTVGEKMMHHFTPQTKQT